MDKRLIKSLLKPSSYTEPTSSVRLVQTHVSYLFLTDTHVYKVKKPVDFGFLNFSTIDRRRFYCNEELRLNRRLCPGIYQDVVEIRESEAGVHIGGDGVLVDYAVQMKRLPDSRMLSRLLAAHAVTHDEIRQLAVVIAKFHLGADCGDEISSFGSVDIIRQNCEESFQQLKEFQGETVTRFDYTLIRDWLGTQLSTREDLFAARVAQGFIRDCDGDLHAENICMTDEICVFDCIEFNARFRYSDTAADIAFLLMDFDYHGRRDLSAVFLDEYRLRTGDDGVESLICFYKVYRAVVRGKVESMLFRDPHLSGEEKSGAKDRAQRYFRLARGYILKERLPQVLILTCGVMGSGKSYLASRLSHELGLSQFVSDRIRKELAGLAATESRVGSYGLGIYSPEVDAATYEELYTRTEMALGRGESVVVDATFKKRRDRDRFVDLAQQYEILPVIVQTVCPDEVIRQRLERRLHAPDVISDGRLEHLERQRAEFEPPGDNGAKLIIVDTSGLIEDTVEYVVRELVPL